MKQVVVVTFLFFSFFLIQAQISLTGYVLDEVEVPHAYAQVSLKGVDAQYTTQTNEYGRYEFEGIKVGTYEQQIITIYGIVRRELKLTRSIESVMTVPRTVKMSEVTVRASRVNTDMPFTYDNIQKEEIESRNLGQDVPYLLKWSPSVVVTSDAGTGIGYTGIRVRGSDPTRTNVTINGIPLNDAESQTVFWVDLPDFLSSTESIQIQRGVGTSVNGAGAFGASINLNTSKLNQKPYAKVNTSIGSFGTLKGNLMLGSGLLNNRWTVDARFSKIHSDGYIDRAEANLTSGYASVGWYGSYSSLKANIFHGKEVTYQAWNGVPAQYINNRTLRRFNTAGAEREGVPHDNEVDDYKQTHYQLLYNTRFNAFIRMNAAGHYTRGLGFFEQYKAAEELQDYAFNSEQESDLIRRRWLDNHFFGGLANINLQGHKDGLSLDVGGAYHHYLGRHFGEVIWNAAAVSSEGVPNYYDNDAVKTDFNFYGKIQSALFTNNLRGYVDLQQRIVGYSFVGLDLNGSELPQKDVHHFFNPKFGLTLRTQENKGQVYASFAVAHKEPNRDDYTESSIDSRPKSERLADVELGYRFANEDWNWSVNIYSMQYRDQIVPTGQINDVGAYTRRNVDQSFRRGVELALQTNVTQKLKIQGNATLSQNKIESFTEFIDNWDYWNQDFVNTPPGDLEPLQFSKQFEDVDLAFSPNFLASLGLDYAILKKDNSSLNVNINGKWVGSQFLDNTGNAEAKLDGYFYADAGISGSFELKGGQKISANFLLRNIFDGLYSSNGWVYRFRSRDYDPRPDDPFVVDDAGANQYNMIGYYPQATRNFLLGLSFDF